MKIKLLPTFHNNFQKIAHSLNVPDEYIENFINQFQMAALIMRVPYQQAILMNNINDIVDYFENQEGLRPAIGILNAYLIINEFISSIASDQSLRTLRSLHTELNNIIIFENYDKKQHPNSPVLEKNSTDYRLEEEDDDLFLGNIKFHPTNDDNFDGSSGSSYI